MKPFDNEWIFEAFEQHRSFFTKRMFGGLAAYLFGRQMMVPGRTNENGTMEVARRAGVHGT
jgi:hypothetical protein